MQLEVLKDTYPDEEKHKREPRRLGFLSEGSFFGESAVLAAQGGVNSKRARTVRAVTDCELCFISRSALRDVSDEYPELDAR